MIKTICTNFVTHISATGGPAALRGGVLYLGCAVGAWAAAALMTGSGARVAAVWTKQHAGLLAAAFCHTLTPVAQPSAAVHITWQRFITHQAAGNVLQMTWDVAALLWCQRKERHFNHRNLKTNRSYGNSQVRRSYLVLSHAPFLSEVCARWALLFTVAVVKH